MSTRRRVLSIAAVLLVLAGGATCALQPYAQSAAFLLDLSGSKTWARALLPGAVTAVKTTDLQIRTRHGVVAARMIEPERAEPSSLPGVIVFPGVHSGGVDEPRLSALSSRLAGTGVRVLSVPLPDLREFRVTPRSTDVIEDVIVWMTDNRALVPSGRVGVAGVSFAGGLALVAAGRPAVADRIQFVASIGGHADLPRVMRYLCTGQLPDGTTRAPHDYGMAIMLLGAADRVVPPEQVEPLRHAVATFLTASSDTSSDTTRAAREFQEARDEARRLADPARTYMQWVNDRNTPELGRVLLPHVEALGGDPALSPERSPATHVPVFLLHGEADNVIPSSETPRLAAYLEEHGDAQVRMLLTPLLTHAHFQEQVTAGDAWRLVSFWTAVRDAAR